MKIVLLIPYSDSICRIKSLKDVIHNSMILELETFLRMNDVETITIDCLGNEDCDRMRVCNEIWQYNPDYIVIQPLHTIEDLTGYQSLRSICPVVAMGPVCCCLSLVEPMVDYVFPTNPEKGLADLIGLDIDEEVILDDVMGSMDVNKLISSQDSRIAYITTSRGCSYGGCSFCIIGAAYSSSSSRYVAVNPLIICRLLKELQEKGVKTVQIMDADFPGSNISRLLEYRDAIRDMNISLKLHCDVRVQSLRNEQIVLLLKEIGIKSVFFGIDGSSDGMLARVNKGISLNSVSKGINNLIANSVAFRFGWILADSSSTLKELEVACDFICSSGLYRMFDPGKLDDPTGLGTFFHEMHVNAGTNEFCKPTLNDRNETSPLYSEEVNEAFKRMWPIRLKLSSEYREKISTVEDKTEKRNIRHDYNLKSIMHFYNIIREINDDIK